MVFYISSPTYQPMISKTLAETEQIVSGQEVGEEIYLLKYIKEHIGMFKDVSCLIIDLLALADTDEEIISALESLRIMDYSTRFVILAARRREGDKLLRDCFYMGIYDLIATDDYLFIHEELTACVLEPKRYKDALKFRDAPEEAECGKTESKAIQKILIGVAGAGARAGCTHNSIVFANFLRQKGYMVAVAEMNPSGAFEQICEVQQAKMLPEGYFAMKGVDFYPAVDNEKLLNVAGKLYNFILIDFGDYMRADRLQYHKCDVRLILAGAKPWETAALLPVFQDVEEDVLKLLHFCFLFTGSEKAWQKDLLESMDPLENVYFPEYTENPFESSHFPEGNAILKDYLPYVEMRKKGGLFGRRDIIRGKNK